MGFDINSAVPVGSGFDVSSATPVDDVNDGSVPSMPIKRAVEKPSAGPIERSIASALSGGKYGSMQDILYTGEKPEDTFTGRAGQVIGHALDEAGGLMGAPAVGSLESAMPLVSKAIAPEVELLNKGKDIVAPYMQKAVSAVADKLKNIPTAVLGRTAGMIDPKALDIVYKISKADSPELNQALNEGMATPVVNRMVYNYGRQHGLSHEDAARAVDMNRGNKFGLGTWDIYDKLVEEGLAQGKELSQIFPKYEDFDKLDLPNKVKLAYQAGVDTGQVLPHSIFGGLGGKSAVSQGIGGLEAMKFGPEVYNAIHNLTNVASGLATLKLLPAAMVQSPRAVGSMYRTAGKTAKAIENLSPYVSKAYQATKPYVMSGLKQLNPLQPTPATYTGLGGLADLYSQ